MRPSNITVPARPAILLVTLAATLAALAGCSSSEPARPRTTTAGKAAEPTALSRPAPAEYGVVSRELAALENASIDTVYQATQDALRGLELKLVDKTKDRLNATLGARTAHDDRVTVSLSRVTSGVTDVKIKVGFWGDESQSRAILTEIRKNLSTPKPGEPIDTTPSGEPGVLAAAGKPIAPAPPPSTSPVAQARPPAARKPLPPATATPASTSQAKTPATTPAKAPATTPAPAVTPAPSSVHPTPRR